MKRIAGSHDLFGGSLREMEESCRWVGLEEIIEEQPLFAAEFEDVPSMHPGEGRIIGVKGVRKTGVCAALVEQRRGVIVHLDHRHAVQAVDLAQNGISGSGENGLQLRVILCDG